MSRNPVPDNPYCRVLGIEVPSLEEVKDHKEAVTYSLLLVALLERGEPMTLEQVARRFDEAGAAPFEKALRSLKRCRPGRAPVYRNGELYSLDPHDDQLDLWAFRLGLRPPKVQLPEPPEKPPVPKGPIPGPEVPVSLGELEEAFEGRSLYSWSRQRLASLLVEAHGEPLHRDRAAEMLGAWTPYHGLTPGSANRWTRGAVREDEEGYWTLDPEDPQLLGARRALREALAEARKHKGSHRTTTARIAEIRARAAEIEERARRALEALRRCLVYGFPKQRPEWVVILDLESREMSFFERDDFAAARSSLEGYEWIGALDVRALLTALEFDAGLRHLAELGPSQKTMAIPGRRPLKITAEAMAKGCSNKTKPFGDEKAMRRFLAEGKTLLLKRRLAKAMESLFGLYHYCKLHGAARVTRGDVEAMIPAPWVREAETKLYKLKAQAFEHGLDIEAALGPYLFLEDPWRHSCRLEPFPLGRYRYGLMDKEGFQVEEWMVLAARLVLSRHEADDTVH